MTYQVAIGILAAAVGLIGYYFYYRDIFRGTTKPHPFSWLGFAILTGITFFAQVAKGGGAGAWVTGVSSVATFGIAALAFRRGEKDITIFDWVCFAGAILGIVLWLLTSDPLFAVVIVTLTDNIAFAPTYRKGYLRPNEETASLYVMSAIKYVIGMAALASFNWTTVLYPITLVITNIGFVAILLYRRRVVSKSV